MTAASPDLHHDAIKRYGRPLQVLRWIDKAVAAVLLLTGTALLISAGGWFANLDRIAAGILLVLAILLSLLARGARRMERALHESASEQR